MLNVGSHRATRQASERSVQWFTAPPLTSTRARPGTWGPGLKAILLLLLTVTVTCPSPARPASQGVCPPHSGTRQAPLRGSSAYPLPAPGHLTRWTPRQGKGSPPAAAGGPTRTGHQLRLAGAQGCVAFRSGPPVCPDSSEGWRGSQPVSLVILEPGKQ